MQVTITSDVGHRFSFGYDPETEYLCLPYDAPVSQQQAYAIMDGRKIPGWTRQPNTPEQPCAARTASRSERTPA